MKALAVEIVLVIVIKNQNRKSRKSLINSLKCQKVEYILIQMPKVGGASKENAQNAVTFKAFLQIFYGNKVLNI